jgi:general secretion pathway protein A
VTVAVVSARDARTEPSAVAAGPPALTTGLDESLTDVDTAYRAVVAQWGKQYERRPYERPCDAVRRVGLECIVRRGTWNVVRRFDLPAVLEIGAARGGLHFLAVTRLSATHATIDTGMRRVTVALDDVERDWDGSFVVVWKPLRPAAVTLAPGARGSDVVWLRQQLSVIDAHPVPADASARIYDEALGVRVTEFQRTQGLTADGIAGVETLARLTALVDRATPSLREPAGGS